MVNEFGGKVYSALLTPFAEDGELDLASLETLVAWEIERGVEGFYVAGTTGEGLLQTRDEHIAAVKTAREVASEKIPVIAHVGTIATGEVVDMARAVVNAGADAVSLVPPFYYRLSESEIVAHFLTVASSVDVPILIYNIPHAVGFEMSDGVIDVLFNHEQIIGIKHTSMNMFKLEGFVSRHPDKLVFGGLDECALAALSMGADGLVSTTANFQFEYFRMIWDSVKRGDLETARRYQRLVNGNVRALLKTNIIPATKAVVRELGVDCGVVRRPLRELTASERNELLESVLPALKA